MINVVKLKKTFGSRVLFEDVSLRLNRGERIGLVGPNGAGKTTLFSILMGQLEPDAGSVEFERNLCFGYLPQESAPAGDETVVELATSITPEFTEIYSILRQNPDPDSPERMEAMERFAELEGYLLEAKAKKILAGLAFRGDDFNVPARTLSGGWIMRAHLAKLLVMEPDLLMLDEPTNHLDLETLGWFQQQLKQYAGGILMISHDRFFLNSICDGIAEIAHGKLHHYTGNYSSYLTQKAARYEQQMAAYNNQQKEIEHLEAFINRFRAKASKAAQAQARMKQLDKMERIAPPEAPEGTISFSFPQPERSGLRVANLEHVRQAYGDHVVYTDLNLNVERDDRVVLVGPNGAGKSTLLKIFAGIVPIQGGVRTIGGNVTVGYFSQQRVEVLNMNNSVLDEAQEQARGVNEQGVRTLLGAFLFKGDAVFKKIHVLSGGEKSRLALVKILLNPPNFLLLDEPTTHLDMASIDALIAALKAYRGTLIFVSHDVHFIREIGKSVVQVEPGKITLYPGDYDYYLFKSGAASAQSGLIAGLNNSRPPQASEKKSDTATVAVSDKERRRLRSEERQSNAGKRKIVEKRISTLEAQILKLEEEQSQIAAKLADPVVYAVAERARELNDQAGRIAKYLAEKNYEWELAIEELEGT